MRESNGSGPVSRRGFLRAAGASGALGTVALPGCMSTLPPLGRRVRFGRVDAPARGPPGYADWLPDSGQLRRDDGDPVDPLSKAMYTTPGNLGRETVGADYSIGASVMRSQLDYFGVGFDAYDWALSAGRGIVLAGDIDVEAVHETVTGTVYEQVDTHRDFAVYRRTDSEKILAVSGTHVVFDAGERAEETVRTLVDTGRGRAERYTEASDDARTFVETVGASPFTWYGLGTRPLGQNADEILASEPTASAQSYAFDADAVYFSTDLRFRPGEVPSTATLRSALESRPRAVKSAGVELTTTDRRVGVEMRIDAADLQRPESGSFVTPQVTWAASYDGDADRLTISHLAGDPVDASTLGVRFDRGPADDRFSPTTGTIEAGDDLTVDLSGLETETVRLYQESPDGSQSSLVYRYELSETNGTDGETGPTDDSDS